MSKLEEDMAKELYNNYCRALLWMEDRWEDEPDEVHKIYFDKARQLIEKFRLVQLDTDQSLPSYIGCKTVGDELTRCLAEEVQQDMLNARFKRVKE